MHYIKHFLLSLLLWVVALPHLSGQGILQNTYIVAGAALGGQDRRMFQYPRAKQVLASNPQKLDNEWTFYMEKRVFKHKFFQLDAGIGYAENNTIFSRPYSHSALGDGYTLEIRHIKKYSINKITAPISGKVYFKKLYFQITVIPASRFRKSVLNLGNGKRTTQQQFAWHSVEINPGVGFQCNNRIRISLSCRGFNFNEIDKVKFFNLLFDEPYPEFLQQKTDTFNPFKMWLTVGYKLKK